MCSVFSFFCQDLKTTWQVYTTSLLSHELVVQKELEQSRHESTRFRLSIYIYSFVYTYNTPVAWCSGESFTNWCQMKLKIVSALASMGAWGISAGLIVCSERRPKPAARPTSSAAATAANTLPKFWLEASGDSGLGNVARRQAPLTHHGMNHRFKEKCCAATQNA